MFEVVKDLAGEVCTLKTEMKNRFDVVDERFEHFEDRFDTVDERFDTLELKEDNLSSESRSYFKRLEE